MAQIQLLNHSNSNIEETNPIPDDFKHLYILKDDSEEFLQYVNELLLKSKANNAKSLCLQCWCFLSAKQKERHLPEHNNGRNIITPSHYSSSFKKLAILHGKAKTIEGTLYFQPILLNPEPHTQTKIPIKQSRPNEEKAELQYNQRNSIFIERLNEEEENHENIEPKIKNFKASDPFTNKEQPVLISLKAINSQNDKKTEEKTLKTTVN